MLFETSFDAFRKSLVNGSSTRKPKLSYARTRTIEETYAALQPLKHRAGITRVADVTGLDRLGIPVVMVARPNSRGLSVSQGKGPDLISAKVSGLMEALEGFHAERPDIPVRLLAWSELAGTERAVDPSKFPRRANACFDPDKRMAWGLAYDIACDTERFIPLDLIHTDLTYPPMPGGGGFPVSSNGLASGNTYAEAICQGLCELIERDAFSRFHAQRNSTFGQVDLAASRNSAIQDALAKIGSAGAHLSVLDLTSDIEVPVFFATITGGSDSPVTALTSGGLGCHPNRVWACLRAIYEAAQSRLTRLVGARDDLTPADYRYSWHREGPNPDADKVMLSLESGPTWSSETVEDDIIWLLGRLAQKGFCEVLVTDLGRPDFGIPVVRVVVPGLEPPPSTDMEPRDRARGAG